ncbi:RNA polymerase sigma factor [Moheibacter sediminis]|uniref:RNA polymerase, sigma subunit, ECF family n=1 Tax=Moheibacter sediminis TaxID=1434700 RepID=A0A1W1YYU9_9FLAO|nr:sigma-70 family RNA polymerase sigma factor [Moheibacter sediminis]SMC41385.1 RNA polymerase, sigma subunit, ECF family [Moheibacter sediminis]
MEIIDDSRLVDAYILGNEAALAELIDRHKNKVYGFIFSKVLDKDIAEDIFQDTFVKVILTLKEGKYNEEGKFLPWVMRIAHNLSIDYFRSRRRMPVIGETFMDEEFSIFDFLADPEDCSETKIIKEQIDKELRQIIDYLPEDQQEVLRLRIFKGLSFKEIAEETDVSINTALGRMRYALINLRKVIEDKNLSLTMV